jgi:hypothetical protein
MVVVVFLPIILSRENLHGTPRGFDGICLVPRIGIHEVYAVIDGAVRVTKRVEIFVVTPAIADDRSAGFDPITYNGRQRVGGSIRNGYKEYSPRPPFNTTKHPLTLNRVPRMVLTPTVNLDDLVRTAYFDGAALQKHEHSFPAEHAPVCDRLLTEAMFVLYLVSTIAAQDVVGDITSLKVR